MCKKITIHHLRSQPIYLMPKIIKYSINLNYHLHSLRSPLQKKFFNIMPQLIMKIIN